MRVFVLALLLLSSTTMAQVIHCPPYYPADDITLPKDAADPTSVVQLERSQLSFARIYSGELYGEQFFTPPDDQKVKGGWNATYDIDAKGNNWLICTYGGTEWADSAGVVHRWEKLEVKAKQCELQVRKIVIREVGTRWRAAASCK